MPTKPVAVLILNRNLPKETDRLAEHVLKWDGDVVDIYGIESGSEPERRSKYAAFCADWPEAREHGLRLPRGFNFGLLELEKVARYDYKFLVCQDTIFSDQPNVHVLLEEMERHPRIGILSPCSPDWGEAKLIPAGETRFFWYINHIAWLFRGKLIDCIKNPDQPTYLDYLYDGTNFRGYDTDLELIAKAYVNDYAAAITTRASFREDGDLMDRNSTVARTEPFQTHRPRMYEEGLKWMRRKYGFNSRWAMLTYVKAFYNQFFEHYPEYLGFKL